MFWLGLLLGIIFGIVIGGVLAIKGANTLRDNEWWKAVRTGTFIYDNRIYEVKEKYV